MKKKIYTLGRNEIIRGFRSFDNILANSTRYVSGSITAFINIREDISDFPVKVGFLLSKKKIKKSHDRNRIRRLLRETYRLNKTELLDAAANNKIILNILFTLTQAAYNNFQEVNFNGLNSDLKFLLNQIAGKIKNK